MTDWIEHDGEPQPVAYDLSQYVRHLIDAARLEGIRLGLEAAARAALLQSHSEPFDLKYIDAVWSCIRALDPDTIAREAALDQLTREAQAQGMGYDHDDAKENTR